jgi:PAS domain S-box-containing protein/diguanylate cyclase (GGDEF)-like protein
MQEFQDWEICRSILESLPSGVCVVDLQKRVVFWSDGAERITGYRRHEVVGRDCLSNVLPHCDKIKSQPCPGNCAIDSAIRNARPVEGTSFIHHKDGHRLQLLVSAIPIHNARGSIIGVVKTFDDHHLPDNPEHREDTLKLSGCVDEVTGLPNHAMMRSHLRESLATFSELHVPFAILYARVEGLDHFRSNFGQRAATSILRAIAQTLETALWKTDLVGRWSEDRLLAILNGCTEDAVHSVCRRLGSLLADEGIEWWGEIRSLSVSLGQASARLDDSVDLLLLRAEHSLEQTSLALPAAAGGQGSGS